MLEKQIEALIEAGWQALESDFNAETFHHWRLRACECLAAICGDDHAYTEHFRHGLEPTERISILSGVGVLTAATMWCSQGDVRTETERMQDEAGAASEASAENRGGLPFPAECCAGRLLN